MASLEQLEQSLKDNPNLALGLEVDPKNVGVSFFGDFSRYAGIELDWFGPEFALLIIAQIFFMVGMFGNLNGRFLRMQQWIHSLDFDVFGNAVKPPMIMTYFQIVGYAYIAFPFLSCLLWVVFLIKDAGRNEQKLDYKNPEFMGAISVLLLSITIIASLITISKIRWNNYRFKLSHMIIFLLSWVTFTIWQFTIMFSSIADNFNFSGISAVFLTQSGIVTCVLIYINLYENKFNLIYFMNRFLKKSGDMPDKERTNDILQEISEQKLDDDWLPCMNDIFDMITIGKISEKKMLNAFGRGFQRLAMDRSALVKMGINGGLTLVYLTILFVYSYMVYTKGDGSKLGIVSSVAVLINDIYLYLMYNARIINRISVLALVIFCSRLFIMLGGPDYWLYGYIVIFVWLECIIALGIVQKRLPYNHELNVGAMTNPNALRKVAFVDLARVPEFIFFIIIISLVCSIVVATSFEPKGVYLEDLPIGEGIEYGAVTAGGILFVVSFLFVYAWLRAFKRKLDKTMGATYIYLCDKKIDEYYIICIICYMIGVFWTLGAYPLFDDPAVLAAGFCIPAILFCLFNVIITYVQNNYYFLEDTAGLNRHIKAHNKRVVSLKKKAKELQIKIMQEGPESVYGEENGKLVQKVMELEVTRRKAAKLVAGLGQADNEQDQQYERSKTGQFGRSIAKSPKKSNAAGVNKVGPSTMTERPDQLVDVDEPANAVANDPMRSGMGGDGKAEMSATMQGFHLDDNSSEEDVDAIPEAFKNFSQKRIDKKRKMITSWRDTDMGFMEAFFKGKLRSRDYTMMWSLILMSALVIIFAATAFAATEDGLGIMYAITLLHVILLVISLLGNILANRRADLWEQILTVGAFALMYICGIVYLFVTYDTSLVGTKDEDLKSLEDKQEKDNAINFVTGELIIIPFITAFLALTAKAYRDNQNGRSMTTGFWILLILNTIHSVALVVMLFAIVDENTAWVALGIFFLAFYALTQYVVRVKYSSRSIKISQNISFTPYKQKKIWNIINIIIATLLVIGTLYYINTHDELATFAGYSLVFGIFVLILLALTLATFVADRTRLDTYPIYHSPWVFPIYKYYPDSNDVEQYSSAVVLFYCTSMLLLVWAICLTIAISPSWIGIALTCAIECMQIVVTVYFINTNNLQYNKVKEYVDQLVIKQAWLDSKENLCKMLQIDSRSEYVSYEKWWRRRHDLRNYMQVWQNKSVLAWPENEEFVVEQEEFECAQNKGAHLRDKVEKWADPDEVNLDSWEDCLSFMYETDQDVRRAYLAELETVIQFQLIVLQNAKKLNEEEKKYLFKFIKEKRHSLYLIGINFEIIASESQEVRYAACLSEIRKLSPDKQTLFNALKLKFIDEERQKAMDEEVAASKEEDAARQREENQAMMSKAKLQALQRLKDNPNMPIDEMPDCSIKLTKIREQTTSSGEKFTDVQFDHNNEEAILGPKIFSMKSARNIQTWKRASEIQGSVLFKDGASHEDITQGALGDCYLLSALSVLGNDKTVELFVCQNDSDHMNESDPNHWKKTGCFMLKFFKNGDFQYIVVDDYIPMNDQGPAFTKGGADGLEMWPAILEKAYAKLYGSYDNIEAGKVHLALADMVENGFPEQIKLAQYRNSVSIFTNLLRVLDRVSALMGAGSPEHELGDGAINEEGIVQGHAYAILDVDDYQGQQLLKLRNPHGKSDMTREWNGDWGDESEQWTQKAKSSLNYKPNEAGEQVDGVFWMSNSDFLNNFKYIYLCRELNERAGWFSKSINSVWEGPSSAGFPGKLRQVPQFKLTIYQPCPGYISMTQKDESGSSFKGKNMIGWMVSREQGKIMSKVSKKNLALKAGISNLKLLSSEITFDEKVSYPYSFTIVCGSKTAGREGEGSFELKVFSRDPKMKLEKLNHK